MASPICSCAVHPVADPIAAPVLPTAPTPPVAAPVLTLVTVSPPASEPKERNWKEKAALVGKILLAALVIATLVLATVFCSIATASLVAGGAAVWKIALFGGAAVGCGVITIGTFIFSVSENMYSHTEQNKRDTENFLLKTGAMISTIGYGAVNIAKELKIMP